MRTRRHPSPRASRACHTPRQRGERGLPRACPGRPAPGHVPGVRRSRGSPGQHARNIMRPSPRHGHGHHAATRPSLRHGRAPARPSNPTCRANRAASAMDGRHQRPAMTLAFSGRASRPPPSSRAAAAPAARTAEARDPCTRPLGTRHPHRSFARRGRCSAVRCASPTNVTPGAGAGRSATGSWLTEGTQVTDPAANRIPAPCAALCPHS
jgi:hypothetical protein